MVVEALRREHALIDTESGAKLESSVVAMMKAFSVVARRCAVEPEDLLCAS